MVTSSGGARRTAPRFRRLPEAAAKNAGKPPSRRKRVLLRQKNVLTNGMTSIKSVPPTYAPSGRFPRLKCCAAAVSGALPVCSQTNPRYAVDQLRTSICFRPRKISSAQGCLILKAGARDRTERGGNIVGLGLSGSDAWRVNLLGKCREHFPCKEPIQFEDFRRRELRDGFEGGHRHVW